MDGKRCVKDILNRMENGVNNLNLHERSQLIREIWGKDARVFACAVICQYARMDGHKYPDYDFRNYAGFGPRSAVADDRNWASIARSAQLMQDPVFAQECRCLLNQYGIHELSLEELRNYAGRDRMDNIGKVIMEAIARMMLQTHRTLQQQIVKGCMEFLKEDGTIRENANIALPFI